MKQQENENNAKRKVSVRGRYLNPKADLTFKLIFGEHKDLVNEGLSDSIWKEGYAKGYAKGYAEGYAEGYAKGRAEVKSDIARKMKEMGMTTDAIAQATGLSAAEIDAL